MGRSVVSEVSKDEDDDDDDDDDDPPRVSSSFQICSIYSSR